jgi:preprotein translocase subunit SecG
MLSGLLIFLDIIVGICLVAVVLMQRSEGGAFGMGGGPTGLITTRGAGDLLTRTTWVLFSLFLALSLGLTLLGAHDRATSAVLQQLKGQIANTNALNQPLAPPAPTPTTAAPTGGAPAGAPLLGGANPLSAPAPQPIAPAPAAAAPAVAAPKPHPNKTAAAPAAPPVLQPPPPAPAPTNAP